MGETFNKTLDLMGKNHGTGWSNPGFKRPPGTAGPEMLWDRGRPNLRSAMLSLNGEMAELHQAEILGWGGIWWDFIVI